MEKECACVSVIKLLKIYTADLENKLECLFLASIFGI
jgi:hypothetical protein